MSYNTVAALDRENGTLHFITQEAQGTEENIDLHKSQILFQETYLSSMT